MFQARASPCGLIKRPLASFCASNPYLQVVKVIYLPKSGRGGVSRTFSVKVRSSNSGKKKFSMNLLISLNHTNIRTLPSMSVCLSVCLSVCMYVAGGYENQM